MTLDKIVCSKDEHHLELFGQGIRATTMRDKYERTLRMITCKMLEGVLDGDFDERMDEMVKPTEAIRSTTVNRGRRK